MSSMSRVSSRQLTSHTDSSSLSAAALCSFLSQSASCPPWAESSCRGGADLAPRPLPRPPWAESSLAVGGALNLSLKVDTPSACTEKRLIRPPAKLLVRRKLSPAWTVASSLPTPTNPASQHSLSRSSQCRSFQCLDKVPCPAEKICLLACLNSASNSGVQHMPDG